jgi:hypothetical protein
MQCPRCGQDRVSGATECARCGVIFAKWENSAASPARVRSYVRNVTIDGGEDDAVADGTLGRSELTILGSGLAAAIVLYAFPLTRMLFSALVTLCHEFGHAVIGWLLGHPSLPAFDFVYGGGFTHMGEFHLAIAIVLGALFLYGFYLFRQNRKSVALIGVVFVLWLIFVTAEWRRELAIASAGHLFEFILAAIFFYQALSGVGLRNPAVERPLSAFAAFFLQIHSMAFAWRLTHDADFLSWYREGKGGALMNDLEVVALDLHIYGGPNLGIEGVAKGLLFFSLLPMLIALVWYLQRARVHKALRSLRTAEV